MRIGARLRMREAMTGEVDAVVDVASVAKARLHWAITRLIGSRPDGLRQRDTLSDAAMARSKGREVENIDSLSRVTLCNAPSIP